MRAQRYWALLHAPQSATIDDVMAIFFQRRQPGRYHNAGLVAMNNPSCPDVTFEEACAAATGARQDEFQFAYTHGAGAEDDGAAAEDVGGPSDELVEAFKGHASVQPLCAEELAQNDRLRTMRGEADGDSAADLEGALVHQYDDSYGEMDAVGDDQPAESFLDLDPN